MCDQITVCPKCMKGALKPAWYDKDYVECVFCNHRVKVK